VDDVRHIALSREPVPEMYYAYQQASVRSFTVVVRTAGPPAAATPYVRAALRAVDPSLPMFDVRTMDNRIAASFAQTRGTMLLLVIVSLLAVALAAVAIYGSIWSSVIQRLPEIGIRVALGATRASICRGVLARALALTAVGAGLGTAAALAAGPLLKSLLFETRTTDPVTYAAVFCMVMLLAFAASLAPARRAMRVDPMTALRAD
jgi:putative ABC transport system permease protein